MHDNIRLTSLSHKGGCGCKIRPDFLDSLLKRSTSLLPSKELLVGNETGDDAAVYQINEQQAIIATTDFFMPIVDDAHDFGAIAATNAISDVYAMGGTPILALAMVGMPIQTLPRASIQEILIGGETACIRAGISIAGGHTIDSLEPIYGLTVLGLAHPKDIKRNVGAKAGDKIILSKALGVGVYCAALKKAKLDDTSYAELLQLTTQLNKPGIQLAKLEGIHALTDVTGFGLIGHLAKMCANSKVSAQIYWDKIPLLKQAHNLAQQGFITGASTSNWQAYHHKITNPDFLGPIEQALFTDPQTSGGLLVACSQDRLEEALAIFRDEGFLDAAVIGEFTEAPNYLLEFKQ